MRRVFSYIGGLTLCALAGCTAGDASVSGGAPKEVITRAISAQVSCMQAQTLRLDDGVSDPRKVGKSVAAACRAESKQAAEVFITGKSPEDQAEFLKNARDDEAALATRVVRQVRATKS